MRRRPRADLHCPYCYEAFGLRDIEFRCSGRTGWGGRRCKPEPDKVLSELHRPGGDPAACLRRENSGHPGRLPTLRGQRPRPGSARPATGGCPPCSGRSPVA